MSELVEELKMEHTFITENVRNIKNVGITSQEGQDILLSVKNALLAHLEKEDKLLYPVLRKEAENNETLKQTLELFASDMKDVSEAASAFFEKYSTGGSGMTFAKDFGRFVSALSQRIGREERIIYVRYDELIDGNDGEL